MSRAADLLREIDDNTDAFCSDEITYEVFSERQRAIWSRIREAGLVVERRVQRALLDRIRRVRP